MIHVSDHTNNRQPSFAFVPYPDRLTICVITRPKSFCKSAINDDDVRPSSCVTIIKLSALQQRNAHSSKVVWKYSAVTHARGFTWSKRLTCYRELAVRISA